MDLAGEEYPVNTMTSTRFQAGHFHDLVDSVTRTASVPIPNPNPRRGRLTLHDWPMPCPEPLGSSESKTSSMDMVGVFQCDAEQDIPCSPIPAENQSQREISVAGPKAGALVSQALADSLESPSASNSVAMPCVMTEMRTLDYTQGISVQLPEMPGPPITTSSSDEASPQLVHVLRRSETLLRADIFQELESVASSSHEDESMQPVALEGPAESPHDVLDDSWVTIDDVHEDVPSCESLSPSSFGQSFLRRHVYPTLRKMSPPHS